MCYNVYSTDQKSSNRECVCEREQNGNRMGTRMRTERVQNGYRTDTEWIPNGNGMDTEWLRITKMEKSVF